MKVRPELGGCVLLLVACRQPNPEWKGAAEEAEVTSDPVTTSTETSNGPGPHQTSSSVDSSDGGTVGQSCNNDNQCPDGWVCGPMGCQQGGPGDPCSGNGDCQAPASLCGPTDLCQTGAAGDPCSSTSHCTNGIMCTNDVCGGGSGSSSSSSGDGSSDGGTTTTGPV